MRIAIFGGGGFIGVNLARHLAGLDGFEPVVYDKVANKLRLRFGAQPMCDFVACDIVNDPERLDAAVAEADVAVNLVAHVLAKHVMDAPLDIVDLNFHGCLHVVRSCVRHRRRLLHFSTCEVYGKTGGNTEPFSEDTTDSILGPVANHRWIYSSAKQLLDRVIHAHGLRGDLEYTIVRPFNFVGPLMDWLGGADDVPRVFACFMSALLDGRPLSLVDGGRNRRCFTHIDDAVRALSAILENAEKTRNQIINIGNPNNETTIAALAELMRDIYRTEFDRNAASEIMSVSGEQFYGPGYEDCDRRMPDVTKMAALGWAPRHDLRTTFELAMRYCMTNLMELKPAAE